MSNVEFILVAFSLLLLLGGLVGGSVVPYWGYGYGLGLGGVGGVGVMLIVVFVLALIGARRRGATPRQSDRPRALELIAEPAVAMDRLASNSAADRAASGCTVEPAEPNNAIQSDG